MEEKSHKPLSPESDKRQAYIDVFTSPRGKEVLKDLVEAHWVLKSTFHPDINEMCLREGERNAILRILTIIDTRPEEVERR